MVVIGALAVLSGLVGTPLIQDQLPLSFMLHSDGQASHQFFRVVPAESQGPGYLPYALLVSGVAMIVAGIVFRRKPHGTAA